ncbi:MAG: radical SAM protein [Nitrospinota bacterium]|nr:MAG: radical SAM protein [Nitrospinota bacterium]
MRLLYNRARIFAGIATYHYLGRRRPVVAYLLLTNRCNLRCRYCFVDVNTIYKSDFTLSEWEATLDNLKKHGGVSICLMGGEPLLFKDIDELILYGKRLGFNIEMTTNGFGLEKHIDAVKRVNAVMLSLDGPQEIMEKNRGKRSYDYVMRALELLQRHKVPVRINCVATKQNKDAIPWLLDFADKHNVWVTFSLTADFPPEAKDLEAEIMLTREEVKEYYRLLLRHKRAGRKILFSEETLRYVIDYPLPYQEILWRNGERLRPKETCLFGQTMIYINSNGDIYPCATLWNTDKFQPKNIRKDGFEAALDHAARLPCKGCFCPGVPEWKRMATLRGALFGLKVTINQVWSHRLNRETPSAITHME